MLTRRTARPLAAVIVVITLSAIALGVLLVLVVTRPRLPANPAGWSGDELARAGCWLAACAYAAWLLVTTLACAVSGVTRWSPPLARQVLRAALAGTLAVAPAPPVILHVGGDGHLVTGPEPRPTRPTATTTPSTTTTITTTTPTATASTQPAVTVPAPIPSAPRAVPAAPGAPRGTARRHVVRAGDNLWTIARSEIALATGRRPDDRAIVPYWQRVIAANRATLRSGDPSLIFPGELITLPAY